MSALWEILDCSTSSANTGFGKCSMDFGQLNYELAIPKGETVSAAQLADFENTVRDKTSDPDPAKRWYLLGPFPIFEQQNTDAQSQTAPNGLIRMTSIGFFGWDLQMWDGGFCANKTLMKFHQSQDRFDFLNIHGSNVVAGVMTKDATGAAAMKGVSMMQVFVPNWSMTDGGSTGTVYKIQFKVGDSKQLRENYTAMKFDFDIAAAATNVIDVTLNAIPVANAPTGDFDVMAVTSCGPENMAALYPTELAATGMWKAYNSKTGVAIDITSVTLTGNRFRVLLSSADTDIPAAGEYVTIGWADMDALSTGGVIGFEAIPTQVKMS